MMRTNEIYYDNYLVIGDRKIPFQTCNIKPNGEVTLTFDNPTLKKIKNMFCTKLKNLKEGDSFVYTNENNGEKTVFIVLSIIDKYIVCIKESGIPELHNFDGFAETSSLPLYESMNEWKEKYLDINDLIITQMNFTPLFEGDLENNRVLDNTHDDFVRLLSFDEYRKYRKILYYYPIKNFCWTSTPVFSDTFEQIICVKDDCFCSMLSKNMAIIRPVVHFSPDTFVEHVVKFDSVKESFK